MIEARRYLCCACGAVVLVVPRGVVPRRLYGASAIAWGLALFGIVLRPLGEVRARTNPARTVGFTAHGRWETLRRWVRAIRAGTLFAQVRRAPASWTLRKLAARAATTAAAQAPPSLRGDSLAAQAFVGGPYMS